MKVTHTYIVYIGKDQATIGEQPHVPDDKKTIKELLAFAIKHMAPGTRGIKVMSRGKVLHKWANLADDWLRLYTL